MKSTSLNPEIIRIFREYKIREGDGVCYLLSLYYGYTPEYIPDTLKAKVNASGIVSIDPKGGLTWRVGLFEGQTTAFDWVQTQYLALFKHYKKHTKFKRECVLRMKKLFAENPDIRKEEVIGGTALYIRSKISEGTPAKYVTNPHYFIEKGKGADRTQQILGWIDQYREAVKDASSIETLSKSITMQ